MVNSDSTGKFYNKNIINLVHSEKYLVNPVKIYLDQPKNVFHVTKDGLFLYDLVTLSKYFSWFNKIVFNLTKDLSSFNKMVLFN